jgi:hypothetical protein
MFALALVVVLAVAQGFPASADAHGPVAPVALDYLARVTGVPAGLEAKAVDGDQRMWLRVPPRETVVVLDYRGAPYLWFSRSGVEVNQNSAMFYLNQTPVALVPPASLGPRTPPQWHRVTGGHAYEWHDGRLHALATVAISPGKSFVGRWTVPVLVDGRRSVISGSLWHRDAPSIVWFWPIAVLLLSVLAAWRVRRPALDWLTARALVVGALVGIAAAGIGRELHGRPTVSVFQLIELAVVLAFVVWGLIRVAFQPPRMFAYFVIAVAALWEGLELSPTLVNGFVLIALPPFVARAATVAALGCAVGLLIMVFRLFDQPEESAAQLRDEDDSAWELV